jgi:hypothetical protein
MGTLSPTNRGALHNAKAFEACCDRKVTGDWHYSHVSIISTYNQNTPSLHLGYPPRLPKSYHTGTDAHYLNRPIQLKYILMKWKNLKKKINPADMDLMVATKRQRSANGKATQFTYYGHVVDDHKLDRATKRPKLTTTTPSSEYLV